MLFIQLFTPLMALGQSSWIWPIGDSLAVDFRSSKPRVFPLDNDGQIARQNMALSTCHGDLIMYADGYYLRDKNSKEITDKILYANGFVLPKQQYSQDSTCFYIIGEESQGSSMSQPLAVYEACFDDSLRMSSFGNRLKFGLERNAYLPGFYSATYFKNNDGSTWIITLDEFDEVRCYKVFPSSIDTNVVVSKTGIKYASNPQIFFGQYRSGVSINHKGNQIVITGVPNHPKNKFSAYIFDFNSKTGKIDSSSRKGILNFKPYPSFKYETNYSTFQSVFAPCDSLLYVTAGPDFLYWNLRDFQRTQFSYLFQINLNSGAIHPVIELYRYHKKGETFQDYLSGLQMAPDGKIYALYHGDDRYWRGTDLSVIHHPNREYPYCNYEHRLGLPVFSSTLPHSHENPPKLEFISPQESDPCVDSLSVHLMIDDAFDKAVLYYGDGDSIIIKSTKFVDSTVFHKYDSNGTYSLKLVGFNRVCGPPLVYLDTISIFRPPKSAGYQLAINSGCDSSLLTLKDSIINGDSISVVWGSIKESIVVPGNSLTFIQFEQTFTVDTLIPLSYTVKNDQCVLTFDTSIFIEVFKKPIQRVGISSSTNDFVNDTIYVCYDQEVELFDSTKGIISSLIDWGDNATTTIIDSVTLRQGLKHLYLKGGLYKVQISDTNFLGCYQTDSVYVRMLNKMQYLISVDDSNACLKDNYYNLAVNGIVDVEGFDDLAQLWLNNDSLGKNMNKRSLSFSKAGEHEFVSKSISVKGCLVLDTFKLIVYNHPIAKLGIIDSNVCQAQSFVEVMDQSLGNFDLAVPGWYCIDGIRCSNSSPNDRHRDYGLKDGTYDLTLSVVSLEGCTDTTSLKLVVYPSPVAQFDNLKTQWCFDDQPVTVTAIKENNLEYYWSWNPGVDTIMGYRYFTSPGKFPIELYVRNNFDCWDTIVGDVEIFPDYVSTIQTQDVCQGDTSIFAVQVTPINHIIKSYSWDIDGLVQGNSSGFKQEFSTYGTYDVKLVTIDDNGCTDTVEELHTVYAVPKAEFDFDRLSSNGNLVTYHFVDRSLNSKYNTWVFENGTTMTDLQSFDYNFPGPDTTSVLLLAMNKKCIDSIAKTLFVIPIIQFFIPTAISPNGDGLNDLFLNQLDTGFIEQFRLSVFNRWGQLIHSSNQLSIDKLSEIMESYESGQVLYVSIEIVDIYGKFHRFYQTLTLVK